MRHKKRSHKAGLPPGSLVYVGDKLIEKNARITLFDFDEQHVLEKVIHQIDECLPFANAQTVTWINVDSLQMPGVMEAFGNCVVTPLMKAGDMSMLASVIEAGLPW